ncbi:hypothetical protein BC940DRAFT_313021 [Gongronella butleri]|nr:hypothetical protein BC940DRAFT_313021 [Gongronella butleri]
MSGPQEMDIDTKPLSLDVLKIINEARMQYGLRHQDYHRYREHCTRRVHRLRQMLSMTQANSKKQNKQKELPEVLDDARYLQLYVYDAERAWAYSMELKQESTTSLDTRKRHHLTKRLKRAAQIAQQLLVLCETHAVDARSVLHAKAYAATMQGYLCFEQQQWNDALTCLLEARTIYDRFARAPGTAPHDQSLAYAAIEDMDANLRFCAYKLQIVANHQDMDALIAQLKQQHNLESLEKQLNSTLGDAATQSGTNAAASNTHFLWRYEPLTIAQPALADAVAKAKDRTAVDLAEQKNVIDRYDALLADWADVEKRVKKLVREDKDAAARVASNKSTKQSEQLAWVHTYITYHYYAYTIHRNLALLDSLKNDKVQHLIKLWDDILKHVGYIQDLPGVKDRHAFESEMEILTSFYKAQRCKLVAKAYVESQKLPEAFALYQRAQLHVTTAKQQLQQSRGFDDDAVLTVTTDDLQRVEAAIQTSIWKAQANWYLHNGDVSEKEAADKMQQMQDEVALLQRLDDYPTTLTPHGAKVPHLIDLPPKFQPIPCKPFYFDLAANHIQYPEALQQRAEANKGSGLWGFLGFGGAK